MSMLKALHIFTLLITLVLAGCVSNVPEKGNKADPQKALETNIRLGMTYLQKGDRERALRAFNEALEIDARSAEAYQGIAMVHQLNGELDRAETQYKKALRLRSDFSKSSIEVGYSRFLYEQNRCSEAAPYLKRASDDIGYNGRESALYLTGLCALRSGNTALAIGSFEHAVNLQPKHAVSAIELADLYFKQESYAKSKKYLDVYNANARQSSRSLLLGIKIERIFGNKDKEASYALALKNLHPYSKEYLEYKKILESEQK